MSQESCNTIYDYNYILSSIEQLGYGIETNNTGQIHIPMAYAVIAMAAAMHKDAQTAIRCADWLIKNPSTTHKTGWGLNWEWDAFSNGIINPSTTVYGVTTAMVVDGLFRTYKLTNHSGYLEVAIKALSDYAEHHTLKDDELYFHYSDQKADQSYSVHNITAMLMAQYLNIGNEVNNEFFVKLASKAYNYLVRTALPAKNYVYWNYGIGTKTERPNDLIHACFIIYGIYQYEKLSSQNSNLLALATSYLSGFIFKNQVLEFHQDSLNSKQLASPKRARAWGLGMLLFISKLLNNLELYERAIHNLPNYEFSEKRFSYHYGDQLHSPRVVGHLLLGVA